MKSTYDNLFDTLVKEVYKKIKPLGFKKDGLNFRYFGIDGLCKIINFQKNKYNTSDNFQFVINVGIYFEKELIVSNNKFKEYDCQIRNRVSDWICLNDEGNTAIMLQNVSDLLKNIENWFYLFSSREQTIKLILNGTAQKYSYLNIINFNIAKQLIEMGYASEVYELIKDTKYTNPNATLLIELAEELMEANR